jgi:hypothetical protein
LLGSASDATQPGPQSLLHQIDGLRQRFPGGMDVNVDAVDVDMGIHPAAGPPRRS